MLYCNLATANVTKFLLSSFFCLPPIDRGSVKCCWKTKCYRSAFHCMAYRLQSFSYLRIFFLMHGLFVYLYIVHHTHDTTAHEFLSRSFDAQLKNKLCFVFQIHCMSSRTAPCLLTGNALPTEPFDLQFLQCVQHLENKISVHFRFISFTRVGIRR